MVTVEQVHQVCQAQAQEYETNASENFGPENQLVNWEKIYSQEKHPQFYMWARFQKLGPIY